MWSEPTAHEVYWCRLLEENVRKLSTPNGKKLLRLMRTDVAMARQYQKLFGKVFDAQGTSIYRLIAAACGETWGKNSMPCNKGQTQQISQHDDMDPAREISVRQRGHELQAGAQGGIQNLEKVRNLEV